MLEVFWKKLQQFQKFFEWTEAFKASWCVSHTSGFEICLQVQIWFFLLFLYWFAVQKGQKVGSFDNLWHQAYRTICCGNKGCNEMKKLVSWLVSILFHVMVEYTFQGSCCTFSKCWLSLTLCRVNLYSFSVATLFKISSNFCSLVDFNFLVQFHFLLYSKMDKALFGIVCFHFLNLRLYQTRFE